MRTKNAIKANAFVENQTIGGKNAGPNQPPKNRTVISEEIRTSPKYSATKNIPNFIPEYSVW
jgi:hypothetical protein